MSMPGPLSLGIVVIVQVLPLQRSAITRESDSRVGVTSPTATQLVAELHETPFSTVAEPPVRLGACCTDQVLTFQCSASTMKEVVGEPEEPTAVQFVAEAQETAFSQASSALAGTAAAWIAQVLPFHCSVNATGSPELLLPCPTAMQLVAEGHETADKSELAGLGVSWAAQVLPFHCSATARSPLLPPLPTAMQLVAEGQETRGGEPARLPWAWRGLSRSWRRWQDRQPTPHNPLPSLKSKL